MMPYGIREQVVMNHPARGLAELDHSTANWPQLIVKYIRQILWWLVLFNQDL